MRASGVVEQVYHVYVHTLVAVHDSPLIPEQHLESSQVNKIPFTHDKCGHTVSLEQCNDTLYDQLFQFNVHEDEFNDMTVVLDVYRRSLGNAFFDDILLGRTILVSRKMLEKNINNETLIASNQAEESKPNSMIELMEQKKKKNGKNRKDFRKRKKKK